MYFVTVAKVRFLLHRENNYGTHPQKWCPFVETTSITVLLFYYKRSSGRSEANLHRVLESYVCMKPAIFKRSLLLLPKKPSDSWKKPSDLWGSCGTNIHSEKCFKRQHHFWMHNILLTASSFSLSNKRIYIEPTEGRYSVEGVGTSQWCPKCAQSSHSLGTQMTINIFSNQNNSWF